MNSRSRAGFTLVEVLVALIILTIGVLGLAGTTALAVRQVTLADVTTERSAALQSVVERLRRTPYAELSSGSYSQGRFTASWTVTPQQRSTAVEVITVGPGFRGGSGLPGLSPSVTDTFTYRIMRP